MCLINFWGVSYGKCGRGKEATDAYFVVDHTGADSHAPPNPQGAVGADSHALLSCTP